jgi:hypothetical protein
MSFNGSTIAASLLVGAVGFVLMSYGMKMKRIPHTAAGLIFMVYPYFIDRALTIFLIAPVVLLLLWLLIRWDL